MSNSLISRRTLLSGLGITAGAVLVGCGQQDAGPTDVPDDLDSVESKLTRDITFGLPTTTLPVYGFPLFPGVDEELRAKYKFGMESKGIKGYTALGAALLSGEVDVAYMTLESLLKARKEGLPLVGFCGFTDETPFVLVSTPDIKSVKELASKKVAVLGPGAIATSVARTVMDVELGDPDAVTYSNIAGTPSRLAALRSGTVAATVVDISGALQAEEQGYAKILARPAEYDRLTSQTQQVIAVNERSLKDNAAMVSAFIGGMVSALDQIYTADPAEVVKKGLEYGTYGQYSVDIWVESLKQAREINLWADGAKVPQAEYDKAVGELSATGAITDDQKLPYDEVITDVFLP